MAQKEKFITVMAAFDDETIQASGSVNLYLLKRTIEWMAPMEERISFSSEER